jgi:hypothetical protein
MRWEALLTVALLAGAAGPAAAGFQADRTDPAPSPDGADQHPVHRYETWETMTAQLQEWANQNPEIVRLHPGDESALGFDLWVVEIADHAAEDKVPLDERETIWLDGGTHANEQLGTVLSMGWLEFLVEGYGENETATWIVENRHTYVMPMVNPDGNHLDSRENARQVDLNRNYPVGWGALDEGRAPVGPGSYPLSEPETRSVVDWWERTEPDYVNSFHTGIELMLYPWGFTEEENPDNRTYRAVCEEIGEPDPDFCGPIHSTIYPAAGGSIDTAYERWGAVSFSYELSSEQNLYASVEDPRDRLERYWDGVEHAFLNVEKYGAHPVVDEVALDGDAVQVTVTNEGYGEVPEGKIALDVEPTPTASLDRLGPSNTTVLTLSVPEGAVADGPLSATLHYEKRHVGSPTDTRTVELPVALDAGQLAADPLEGNDTQPDLAPASAEDADGSNGVPGPGPALAIAALAGLATARRRG